MKTVLFDKYDLPDFEGLTAEEAWQACVDWEAWMYCEAESFSDDCWGEMVKLARANYARYYKEYENE